MLLPINHEDESRESKNTQQTNIIVDLRDAILQIGKHFQSSDSQNIKLVKNFNELIKIDTLLRILSILN